MLPQLKIRPRHHTQTVASIEALPNPHFERAYRFWLDARTDELPPETAIDPLKLPRELLAHVTIITVHDGPKRFFIRLVGTAIVNATGVELTGQYAEDIAVGESIVQRYSTCLAKRVPMYCEGPCLASLVDYKSYDCLVLPFGDAAGRVSRFLTYIEFY